MSSWNPPKALMPLYTEDGTHALSIDDRGMPRDPDGRLIRLTPEHIQETLYADVPVRLYVRLHSDTLVVIDPRTECPGATAH